MSRPVGLLILAVTIAVLVGIVVYIFRRAGRREHAGVDGSAGTRFWPQSSIGQLGGVALALIVVAMLASFVAMGD